MKSIFEKGNFEEITNRLKKINASSTPAWGKMDAGQMLHHMNLAMEAPLGKLQVQGKPNFIMRIFRGVLYNDKSFGKGSPTPKDFKVTGTYDVEAEKANCLANLQEIFTKGSGNTYQPHVFFGKLTSEQWGMHFYKHFDHHLTQFGL